MCFHTFWFPKCASRLGRVHFLTGGTSKSRPKLCALTLLTYKCASHLAACTFWPTLPREGVRARRLSEPIFWPLQTQTTLKNTPFHVIVLSLRFRLRGSSLYSWSFLYPLLFSLLLISLFSALLLCSSAISFQSFHRLEVWFLNFLRQIYLYTLYLYIYTYLYSHHQTLWTHKNTLWWETRV